MSVHPSGIFIPDENSTPFSLDLLQTSERLIIKVGSWNEGGEAGEDFQLIKLHNGGWLLKAKYPSRNPQVLGDLHFVWRYFRESKWASILSVDNYGGGNIIFLYPPRKEQGEEASDDCD